MKSIVMTFALGGTLVLSVFVQAQTSLNTVPSSRWHVQAAPFISQEIRFSNGDAHLVGTVYMPEQGGHLPAIVVFHSAMAATRQAALYRHLCEGLPPLGIAVLIFDRRGSGQSSGSTKDISYETLADDGIAGQHALAKLARIDPHRIGFWGLSQGGWLAVLAAGRSPDAAFAISVSAPLVTAEEQMRFAITNRLIVNGYSQSDVREMLDARLAWTNYLRGKASRLEAVEALTQAQSKPWFGLTYMDSASELTTDPEHNSYRKEMDADPEAAALSVKVPLLFIYGDTDPWIPVKESVEKLEGLRQTRHNIDYLIVHNADHEMMFPVKETMEVDAATMRSDAPQSPAYFFVLGSWLTEHAQESKSLMK